MSLLIKNNIPQSQVPLRTHLKAVAARVTLDRTITICSIYLSPSQNIHLTDLNDLFAQLPSPAMLLGDFNAHNILWGGHSTDHRGDLIERFLSRQNLSLWNDDSPTHLNSGTKTFSSIDLSICHPSLLLDYTWQTEDDPCGSDHFPIILNGKYDIPERIPTWNISKADWDLFTSLWEERMQESDFLEAEDPVQLFTETLCNIAEQAIPKTSAKFGKHQKPWFTDDCREARKLRRKAFKKFTRHPTGECLMKYKEQKARSRRTCRSNRRHCWRDFVSRLNWQTPISKAWNMIQRICGKEGGPRTAHLKVDGSLITDTKQIANTLAQKFADNSSTTNHSLHFQKYKEKAEKTKLNLTSDNTEDYNQPFSLTELKTSLCQSHDTT